MNLCSDPNPRHNQNTPNEFTVSFAPHRKSFPRKCPTNKGNGRTDDDDDHDDDVGLHPLANNTTAHTIPLPQILGRLVGSCISERIALFNKVSRINNGAQ